LLAGLGLLLLLARLTHGRRGAGAADYVTAKLVYCAAHLARFKQPAAIEVVEELPHSAIGKVRKRELA